MAEYFKGTVLASPIVRSSSGNTYATHHSVLGSGGYMEVGTIAQRNAIPVDGIANTIYFDGLSSGQRRLGMLVHVLSDDTIYQLHPKVGGSFISYNTWTGYTDSQKYNALNNNSNWYSLFSTGSGGTATGEYISKQYYQITHGFVLGDVIGFNGTNYTKVNTSTANTIEPLGVVIRSDYDGTGGTNSTFTLAFAGYVSTTGFKDYSGGTLTAGSVYYLASNPTGKLSKYAPTGLTDVSKPVLVALTGNTGIVLQYRGMTKTDVGVTLNTFNTYTADTKTYLDTTVTGATNIGYFSGKTGVQTLVISNVFAPTYNGTYYSQYNYFYRDSSGKIRIGSPTHGGDLRRGYVRTTPSAKSWVYNTYTGSSNQVGWILVDGDINQYVGTYINAYPAAGAMYSAVTWNTGGYNNGGAVILTASGSLTTGSTYNVGGPIYSDKQYSELRLRTIKSLNSSTLGVTYDDNFIYLSGSTAGGVTASNVGAGVGTFAVKSGSNLQFRAIQGSGSTNVNLQPDGSIMVYSSSGAGTITGATNGLGVTGKNIKLGGDLTESTVFNDIRASKVGFQYAADYSAFFTPESLITKRYADAIASGLYAKEAVQVATTGATNNIDLIGGTFVSGSTIDGVVVLDNYRVLIKNQTDSIQNGIYTYSGSQNKFYRATDFDGTPGGEVVQGSYVYVMKGTNNIGSGWVLLTADPITVNITPLTFGLFNNLNGVEAGTGITVTLVGNMNKVSVDGASLVGNSMYWSGNTFNVDVNSGNLKTQLDNKVSVSAFDTFTNVTLPNDYYNKIQVDAKFSSGGTYNLSSPSVIPVGGICAGTVLIGKTAFQLFEELLVPELCGTITAPSTSIGLSQTGTFEIGCVISQTITGTFSRGCISPQYCSLSDKRSGCANAYCFVGTGMPSGFQACASSPASQTNASYTVISGAQTWCVCTRYDCGLPALGSKGTQYCAALNSGCTAAVSASITGIYPYYYGKLTSGSRPAVTNALVTGGTKVVSSSTSTVTVDFDSSSSEYTWVAIPSISTSKTCWYVNALDNGRINNAPSDKYPDECVISISSGQGCWSSVNYKVYMSGTVGAITDPIQFRNS